MNDLLEALSGRSITKLVTVAVPIFKRLQYLPQVLDIVAAQDYPEIELLVSDNGMNGAIVSDIVRRHYPKPFRFRQNPATVSMPIHFNQLIDNASGEFIVILADDDEITSNYVSDLVGLLEKHSEASVALSVQESIDGVGKVISRSKDTVPELMSGTDFIRAIWGTREYGYRSLSTFLAKTKRLKADGGWPVFRVAQGDEDALIVRMCLDNFVVFSTRSTFRKRYEDTTDQGSLPVLELAKGVSDFLRFFDTDPKILKYAASHPVLWAELKRHLVNNAWRTYYFRWSGMYREKMPAVRWFMAAFALPFIPNYYKKIAYTLMRLAFAQAKKMLPAPYDLPKQ